MPILASRSLNLVLIYLLAATPPAIPAPPAPQQLYILLLQHTEPSMQLLHTWRSQESKVGAEADTPPLLWTGYPMGSQTG